MTVIISIQCAEYKDVVTMYCYAKRRHLPCVAVKDFKMYKVYLNGNKRQRNTIGRYCSQYLRDALGRRFSTRTVNPNTLRILEEDVLREMCVGTPEEFCTGPERPRLVQREH